MYLVLALTSISIKPKLLPIISTKSIVRAVKIARIAQLSGHSLFRIGDSISIFKMQGNVFISPKEDVKVFTIAINDVNRKVEAWHNADVESEFLAKTKPKALKSSSTKNQA